MTASDPAAKAHLRTRRDHADETAQDYVEAVAELLASAGKCRVTDLAERFGVSHVTVSRTIGRLRRDGLVEAPPYGPIGLTEKGRSLAEAAHRRHEIVRRFLLALGVSERTAAVDAEGIEHHVSPETLRAMAAFAEQTGGAAPPRRPPPPPQNRRR